MTLHSWCYLMVFRDIHDILMLCGISLSARDISWKAMVCVWEYKWALVLRKSHGLIMTCHENPALLGFSATSCDNWWRMVTRQQVAQNRRQVATSHDKSRHTTRYHEGTQGVTWYFMTCHDTSNYSRTACHGNKLHAVSTWKYHVMSRRQTRCVMECHGMSWHRSQKCRSLLFLPSGFC